MKYILGLIIIFISVNILVALSTSKNCSSYYVIFEETMFGYEPRLLTDIDLRLLDPAIPRSCYLGLYCDNIQTDCQPRLRKEQKNGSHIFIPDPSIVTKDTAILTSATSPKDLTTNSVTDTPSIDISPALSTIPPANRTITVTEAPGVSTKAFLTDSPIINITPIITKATKTKVPTVLQVSNKNAVTYTLTVKNVDITPAITKPPTSITVTEIPTISTTNAKTTDTPTVGNVSTITKAPAVSSTLTIAKAPKISTTKVVTDTSTIDPTPATSKTSTAHTTAAIATDISTVDTTVTSAKAPTISTTITDAPTISTTITDATIPTKSNVYNTDDTTLGPYAGDKSENKYQNKRRNPSIGSIHSTMNHLLSVLQNKSETDIILLIVLIAIGLFTFNILCYLALRKADAVTTSERYDIAKYE